MTPGSLRRTTGNIHVDLSPACRVFSAHLRSPALSYLLRSMSCALKVDGAPDRAASLGAPSSGAGLSGRGNVQRALPDTVRRPTCHGILHTPLGPMEKQLRGMMDSPFVPPISPSNSTQGSVSAPLLERSRISKCFGLRRGSPSNAQLSLVSAATSLKESRKA